MSEHKFNSKIAQWIEDRLPILSPIHHALYAYPTPRNLNYWWNFGSLAGFVLVLMILTGLFLAMHYTPQKDLAFASVEHIMRDVPGGWLLRYIHMNGASFFFVVVYIHIFRGMYYGSYKSPREILWILGVIILLLMMATAFMGYVLPWGQMSYWGATVITNLFSVIPAMGQAVVEHLLGGFTVDNPTLNRFFVLHFLLPFVIVAVVGLHIIALHKTKSNNPTGIEIKQDSDTVSFHPLYTWKDLFGVGAFLLIFSFFVFYLPNQLGEPDNYIQANPLQTPPHIVPEWYFWPFYAILRSIPDKLFGVIAMFASIAVLFALPWLDRSPVKSATYRPLYRIFFILLLVDCLFLGWIGSKPAEQPYIILGQIGTIWYFFHFLFILPFLPKFEKTKPLPNSITEAVLAKKGA